MSNRIESDHYPTDPALAFALVARLVQDGWIGRDNWTLEPSVGSGSFLEPLRAVSKHVDCIDPHRQLNKLEHDDVAAIYECTLEHWASEESRRSSRPVRKDYDFVCGNPPYSLAEEHCRLSLGLLGAEGCLVFLLRSAFYESKKRTAFFDAHPPACIYQLAERPSFIWSWKCLRCQQKWTSEPGAKFVICPAGECTGTKFRITKSDSSAYSLFVWRKGWTGDTIARRIDSWSKAA